MSRSLLWSKKLAKEMTCERKYEVQTFLMSHSFLILTISHDTFCRSVSVYKPRVVFIVIHELEKNNARSETETPLPNTKSMRYVSCEFIRFQMRN